MKDALSILNKNQQTDFVGLPKYSLYVFIILVMLLHFNVFLNKIIMLVKILAKLFEETYLVLS